MKVVHESGDCADCTLLGRDVAPNMSSIPWLMKKFVETDLTIDIKSAGRPREQYFFSEHCGCEK